MKKITLLFGLALLIYACSPKTAEVVVAPTPKPEMSFPNEAVASGYATYSSDCVKCHEHKVVKSYTREAWNNILPDMAKKAKITDATQAAVNDYINWELAN